MRKKIYFGLIVFVILILLFFIFLYPYLMGLFLKKNIEKLVKRASFLENGEQVNIVHYHTGWMSSIIDLQFISPTGDNLSSLPHQLIFDMHINLSHGALWQQGLGAGQGTVVLNQSNWTAASQKMTLQQWPILSEPTNVGFSMGWNGATLLRLEKMPGTVYLNTEKHLTVSHGNLISNINVNRARNKIKGYVLLKDLIAKQDNYVVTIDTVRSDVDLKKESFGFWYGSNTLSVPTIIATEKDLVIGRVNQINLIRKLWLDKQMMQGSLTLTVDKMQAMVEMLGPFKFNLVVHNVHPGYLSQLFHVAQSSNIKTQESDETGQQLLTQLMPEFLRTMMGVTVSLDTLEMNTPEGLVKLNGETVFPSTLSVPFSQANAAHEFKKNTNITLYFKAPKKLLATLSELSSAVLQENESSLDTFLQRGLLVPSGHDYVAVIHYNQNMLTVNGQKFSERQQFTEERKDKKK
jgi:uncharacterized protein YdgA (DUF945 family)